MRKNANVDSRHILHHQLTQHLQQAGELYKRILSQLSAITHAEVPNWIVLHHECELFCREYHALANHALQLKQLVEEKIQTLKIAASSDCSEPILAAVLQHIMILHLVSDQAMGNRVDELKDNERRGRDAVKQLEQAYNSCRQRYDEIVCKLNLLCYIRDCLQREGILPGNVMYVTHLPHVVCSPFSKEGQIPKPQGIIMEQKPLLSKAVVRRESDFQRKKKL